MVGYELLNEPASSIIYFSAFNTGTDNFLPRVIKQDTFEKNYIARCRQSPTRPRFVVAYQSGVLQLMRGELDTREFRIHCCIFY